MSRTAIIAGSGALPDTLVEALDNPVFVTFSDRSVPAGAEPLSARIEKLGQLFKSLKELKVDTLCFAGAMSRPKINPLKLDRHALRLAMSLGKGDDALLREVTELFTEQGFAIKAAHEICPELTLPAGTIWGKAPDEMARSDANRAYEVLKSLSPLDVGQAAVCAGGQMLGIETVQGTDAMLRFVADTPEHLRRAPGAFVKTPKQGQDMRIDVPTIGLNTVENVIKAGLGGIAVPAGEVIVVDANKVQQRIEEAGLFLITL